MFAVIPEGTVPPLVLELMLALQGGQATGPHQSLGNTFAPAALPLLLLLQNQHVAEINDSNLLPLLKVAHSLVESGV